MKRPAFQFYPADWRKDVELRSCSIAARGLWMDMLCIAHECDPYGHLTVNGKAMNATQLAGQVGLARSKCAALLQELLDNGVARQNEQGVIYSKRMVDDESLRNRRAAGGLAGAEHGVKGAEHGVKGGRPEAQKGGFETPLETPLGCTQKPPPSSSSSSSSSEEPPSPRKRGRVHEFPPGFETFWLAYPKKAAKDAAAKAFTRLKADDAMLQRMLAALDVQRESPQWLKDGGQFIPNAATWLNGRRWDDELPGADSTPKPWAGAL